MKIVNCEQRSDEWFEARRGIPTASSFDKIITTTGSPSKQAQGYLYTLAAERVSGTYEMSFLSAAMEEGVRREEEARAVYSMLKETEVDQVGFCLSDSEKYGCSPDGLVGNDGMIEIKNPTGKVAVEYLLNRKVPTQYIQQIQGQLLVTGRQWCDFFSYYPGLPPLIIRVGRDEEFIAALSKELESFCDQLDKVCAAIKAEQK